MVEEIPKCKVCGKPVVSEMDEEVLWCENEDCAIYAVKITRRAYDVCNADTFTDNAHLLKKSDISRKK